MENQNNPHPAYRKFYYKIQGTKMEFRITSQLLLFQNRRVLCSLVSNELNHFGFKVKKLRWVCPNKLCLKFFVSQKKEEEDVL